jgi:hypothetical protein
MESRIQFRINAETKCLAQQMAEQQRKAISHDEWITNQVAEAFARLDAGQATFISHDAAKTIMAEHKAQGLHDQ